MKQSTKFPKGFASGFHAHRSGVNQNLVALAWTTCDFTTKDYDPLDEFDVAIANAFVPRFRGIYHVCLRVSIFNSVANGLFSLRLISTGALLHGVTERQYLVGIYGYSTLELNILKLLVAGDELIPEVYSQFGAPPRMGGAMQFSSYSAQRLY